MWKKCEKVYSIQKNCANKVQNIYKNNTVYPNIYYLYLHAIPNPCFWNITSFTFPQGTFVHCIAQTHDLCAAHNTLYMLYM